jgi:hypothetical protein
VFEERARVLAALDACEKGQKPPELVEKLKSLNAKIDAFRREDYAKSMPPEPDAEAVATLQAANDELVKVYKKILDRLTSIYGENKETV